MQFIKISGLSVDRADVRLVNGPSEKENERPRRERAPVGALIELLRPLLHPESEADAWRQATTFVRNHYSVDFAGAIEFLAVDRAVFRCAGDMPGIDDDFEFPLAPDSQVAFIRSSDEVIVSGEIEADARFTAPSLLTSHGIRSSMSVSFTLESGYGGLIGVHSRRPNHFATADYDTLGAVAQLLGTVVDRARFQCDLEVDARTDPVTGLDNRATILSDLSDRLDSKRSVTALLIDLDGFKSVNDQLGHRAGDSVLKVIADRIARSVESGDHLGRLGGDEFLLLLNGSAGPARAEQILGHIEEIISVDTRSVSVSASIGVSRSRPGDDVAAVLERADRMMYAAKSMGRGYVKTDIPFGPGAAVVAESEIERPDVTLALVDHAIANLRILVQPIVEAATGTPYGVEVLTRGPEGSELELPENLFAAATEFGRLGELELASKRLAFELDIDDHLSLFINLEPSLLSDSEWLGQLRNAWHASKMSRRVVAEVTERLVMKDPGRLLDAVGACRELGWQIALDDVGSRSEGLAALRWVEPDIVKLDMSLIRNENPAHSAHVIAAIAAYRANTSRREVVVIAEGVETNADVALADVLGADLLQGFHFGRPGKVDDLEALKNNIVSAATPRPIPYIGERIGTKTELLSLSRHIEASALSPDCIVLATIQDASNFTRRTRRQYRALARRCGFVGVLGKNMGSVSDSLAIGVRLVDLDEDDPLVDTWQVLAMSPTTSLGLLAEEVPQEDGGQPDDLDRLFRYRFVSDAGEVETAVRRLLRHF